MITYVNTFSSLIFVMETQCDFCEVGSELQLGTSYLSFALRLRICSDGSRVQFASYEAFPNGFPQNQTNLL
jgi:hypothetical protein